MPLRFESIALIYSLPIYPQQLTMLIRPLVDNVRDFHINKKKSQMLLTVQ